MNSVEFIFRVLFDASLRMACLIAVFMALRSLLRGQVSARVLFWVWIALAIRLVIPFAVPVKWSPFNLTHFAYHDSSALEPQGLAAEPALSAVIAPQRTPSAPVSFPKEPSASLAPLSPVQWAASVWAIGVTVLLIGRALAYRRFVSRLRQADPATSSVLRTFAAQAATELGLRGIQVVITDSVGAPALHGVFQPKLLFPPGLLEKLDPHEIQLIVAHELGHYHRRDLLAHALIHAAWILHWFNPLVWIAARAARHDCELACDEYVVRRLGSTEPQIYGATLLKILGMASQSPKGPLGLGIVESKQQLKWRIQMIIANRSSSLTRTVLGCLLLALIAGLSLTREAQAQQPATAAVPAVTTTPPKGWWKNGTDNASTYIAGVDRTQTHEGLPSAYVKSIPPSIEGFGGMMQMCSAENFVGKRLRLSAWMKTEKANDGGAHLWFRVDGKEKNELLQFDNMDGRSVKGTNDWKPYTVVLDVPANAAALAYGFFVTGTGQVWVSDVKIEEVGLDVPSTNMTANKVRSLPNTPVNLRFE
jgi:bla regulator protein BlaR1